MGWLNYHHLYYFHVIAREGSIAKASRILKIGQSALSIQLKQLEEFLETNLFDRKSQRLVLTDSGTLVLKYANAIFSLGTEMLETVKEKRSTSAIRLDVGVLDSVPKSVTHQLVTEAIAKKGCYVSISEADSAGLLRGLISHRFHLVLSNSHSLVAPESEFFSRCVGDFSVIVCGSAKFRKLAKNFPKSLTGQPFLLPSVDSKLRSDLEHYFEKWKIKPLLVGESQEGELDKRLAMSGDVLIAVTTHEVKSQISEKKLYRIGALEPIREQIWLTGIRRHIANPVAAEILENFKVH